MAVTEKPGIVERLGVALADGNLRQHAEKTMPADLVGALAYTQLRPVASGRDAPVVLMIDPRTELGAVLLRLKYADDRTVLHQAALLLEHWVRNQRLFGRWGVGSDLLAKFVRHGLAEWVHSVCPVCHGRKYLGVDRGETLEKRVRCRPCKGTGQVHGKRSENANTAVTMDCVACRGFGSKLERRVAKDKARVCDACRGVGHRLPPDAQRIIALGVSPAVYQKHWLRRFDWLAASFDRIDAAARWGLQSQMRAFTNAA